MIGKKYNDDSYLISLLANQKKVLVHSERLKSTVEKILSKLPSDARAKVVYIPLPGVELVYEDLKPDLSMVDYPRTVNLHAPLTTFSKLAKIITRESVKPKRLK